MGTEEEGGCVSAESLIADARATAKELVTRNREACRIYRGPDRYVIKPWSRGPYNEPGFTLVEIVGTPPA